MSEPNPTVCYGCPFSASYEAAQQVLEENETFFRTKSDIPVHLGFIALQRFVHETLAEKIDCEGPQRNSNNVLVCSLDGAIGDTHNLMSGPNPYGKSVFRFETWAGLVEADDDSGQYL